MTDNPAYKGESDCKIEEYSSQKSIEIQTSKDNWKKADKYHEHGIRKPPEGKKKRIFYNSRQRESIAGNQSISIKAYRYDKKFYNEEKNKKDIAKKRKTHLPDDQKISGQDQLKKKRTKPESSSLFEIVFKSIKKLPGNITFIFLNEFKHNRIEGGSRGAHSKQRNGKNNPKYIEKKKIGYAGKKTKNNVICYVFQNIHLSVLAVVPWDFMGDVMMSAACSALCTSKILS
ncbi:hypothetical protein Lac1_05100 [Claveliimonas bilis]|uniref:Uncharacterized protein n=1 Tax=Claveliimonas bilis TaxID=3028070 RepID=A0ABN6YTI8_9FIRM|nr:hypothetical protein [Claveliimonas bilis]BDZ76327.1 hypothetical protein Lac1_05100 [Claveliimonas bilis]